MIHRQNKIDIRKIQRSIINEMGHIDEEYVSIQDKDAIFERHCVYDGQYDDAHAISEKVISMIESGSKSEVMDWEFKNLKGLDRLSISVNAMPNQKANATSEISGSTLALEVSAPLYDEISSIDISRWKEQVEAAITHELSHAKIESEQGPTDEDGFSEISEKIIYSQSIVNDYRYKFILMSYFCYYHEIQSYVSQIPPEINAIIGGKERVSAEDLLAALKKTSVYKTYLWAKAVLLQNIKSFDAEMIEAVANEYGKYNTDIGNDIKANFPKYLHYFEEKIEFAFRKIRQVFNYVLEEYGVL